MFTWHYFLFLFIYFKHCPVLFVYLNIWWTHGVHHGDYIKSNDMSYAYYWKIVGQFHPDPRDRKFLFLTEDFNGSPKNKRILFFNDFETDTVGTSVVEGNRMVQMKELRVMARSYIISRQRIPEKWIRFSADITCLINNWYYNAMTQMGICFSKNGRVIKDNRLLLDELFYKEKSQTIFIDIKVPQEEYDKVEVYIRNENEAQGSFFIDNFKAEAFNE